MTEGHFGEQSVMGILRLAFFFLRGLLLGRATLAAENLALRQQWLVLQRSVKRPRPRRWDRVFWSWLSRFWKNWPSCLVLVKPETVIGWQRQGFKLYCERLPGSIRRDCLDHVIVLNEDHLRRILKAYFEYYHHSRTHLSLERNAPIPREVEPPCCGKVRSVPQLGGLHHRYTRAA
jgi:hypothetical protein